MSYRSIVIIFSILLYSPICLSETSSEFYEKAMTSFESSQLDDAYIHLKNSLNKDAQHLPSKILMGKVLALSFYYDDAIVELEEALIAGADPNLVIEYLANSFLLQQRFEDILQISERGLSTRNRALLIAIKAKAHYGLDDYEQALRLYKQALDLDPNSVGILNAYANFLLNTGKTQQSLDTLIRAASIEPDNVETIRLTANVYKEQQDSAKYLAKLEQAIALKSDQPLVLRDLISAYMSKNEYQKAKVLLEQVLASSQDEPMAVLLLSWVNAELGNRETATEDLEQLVNRLSLLDDSALKNASGLLYINAMANYAIGNLETARQELIKYLNLQPFDLRASTLLAGIYAQEENFTSAVNVLEKFRDHALNDLAFADKLCNLYISAKSNHKCTWLVTQLAKNYEGDPRYTALKAKSYAARGKLSEALDTLQDAEESESVLIDKALLSIEANKLDDATQILEKLLQINPDSNDYRNLLASISIKNGELAKARLALNEILENNPTHFSARFNLASVYFNLGNMDAAAPITKALSEERPQQINVLLLLARIEKANGNNQAAITLLNDALVFNDDFLDAQLELIDIYARTQQYDDALLILHQLIKANFLNPQFIALRARILLQKGSMDKALEDLDTLTGIYGNDVDGLFSVALMQREAGDIQRAINTLNKAVEQSPQAFYLRREQVRMQLQSGNIITSKALATQLASEFTKEADTWLLMGDIESVSSQLELASQHYAKAIELDNQFYQAMAKRYQLARQGVASEDFIAQLEKIISKNPERLIPRNIAADYYLGRSQLSLAKAHYLQIAKSKNYSNLASVFNNLAYLFIEEGNVNTGYEYAQRANNIEANNQSILDTLGWSLVLLGEANKGLNYLRQAFSMNTAAPEIRYHIAYALNQLGREQDAKQELHNLLTNFDDFPDKEAAQALFDTL